MEIERKFWIKKSDAFTFKRMSIIVQHYINKPSDYYEIRLRNYVSENRYYLEFKSKGNLIREEFGTKLTEEQYNNILNGVNKNDIFSIRKKRYYLNEDGVFYDRYMDKLEGLETLEVEGDNNYVKNYTLKYPWNLEAIEVTNDDRFKNRNLSMVTYDDIIKKFNY